MASIKKTKKYISSDEVINIVGNSIELNMSAITAVREYCDQHGYEWGRRERTMVKETVEAMRR